MLDVHNGQPLPEFREIPNDGVGIGFFLPCATASLSHALPKELGFADQGGLAGAGVESAINRRDGDAEIDSTVDKCRPVVAGLWMKLCLGQILQQQLATPLALRTEQYGSLMIFDKARQLFLVGTRSVGLGELRCRFEGGSCVGG